MLIVKKSGGENLEDYTGNDEIWGGNPGIILAMRKSQGEQGGVAGVEGDSLKYHRFPRYPSRIFGRGPPPSPYLNTILHKRFHVSGQGNSKLLQRPVPSTSDREMTMVNLILLVQGFPTVTLFRRIHMFRGPCSISQKLIPRPFVQIMSKYGDPCHGCDFL